MAAKRGLRRLIQRAAKRVRSKNTVPTPSSKTTLQKAKDVRTKAKKASTTKVQTAPPTRKIGTKATLNGKPVYWDGKGWSKETPSQQITSKSATPKKKKPVKPSASQPLVKKKAPQKIETKKPTKSSTVKSPASRAETLKTKQSRKGVVPTQVSKSKQQAVVKKSARKNTSSNVSDDTTYLGKTAANDGVANQRDKRGRLTKEAKAARLKESRSRTAVSKTKTPTRKQKTEQDIRNYARTKGASDKRITQKTPKSTADTASQARGSIHSPEAYGKGSSEHIDKRRTARERQSLQIQERRKGQLEAEGRSQRKGRVARLSAADARAAADDYEADKMTELVKQRDAKGLTGREASNFIRDGRRQIRRDAASIRRNARSVSLDTQTRGKNNASPSHAYQDLNKPSDKKTLKNEQTRGERLSKDFSLRVSGSKVRTPESLDAPTTRPVKPKAGASTSVSRTGPGVRQLPLVEKTSRTSVSNKPNVQWRGKENSVSSKLNVPWRGKENPVALLKRSTNPTLAPLLNAHRLNRP